jgi:mRNA-degrading endonuclease toxin of MazEF toxin-antitoxin module
MVFQVRALDRARFERRIGGLAQRDLDRLLAALARLVGSGPG